MTAIKHNKPAKAVKPAKATKPGKDTKTSGDTKPIKQKEDVQKSNDEHIDQDFPGYPHHPSKENVISNGSANAFERTEDPYDGNDSDEDNDDLALNRSNY